MPDFDTPAPTPDSAAPTPWLVLQLAPTADTRDIKRAYARLAKVTRAEDDPAGFQRLRVAYETALRWAETATAATDAAPAAAMAKPDATPTPAPVAAAEPARPNIAAEPAEPVTVQPAAGAPAPPHPIEDAIEDALRQLADVAHDIGQFDETLAQLQATPALRPPAQQQRWSHAVLDWLRSQDNVRPEIAELAAARLDWRHDASLTNAQGRWLLRLHQGRLQRKGAQLAALLRQQPGAAVPSALQQWLALNPPEGLEDPQWLQLGLLRGLIETEASADVIEAVSAALGWDQDLKPLLQLDAALLQRLPHALEQRRRERDQARYLASMHDLATRPLQLEERAPQWAMRALMSPYRPWLFRAQALYWPIQQHAQRLLQHMHTHQPGVARELDARTLAFWRQPQPNYGATPWATLLVSFVLSLFVWSNIASAVEHIPGGQWLRHGWLWLVLLGSLAAPLALWWLFNRVLHNPLPRLVALDQRLSLRVAPVGLRGLVAAGQLRLGWRALLTLGVALFLGCWSINNRPPHPGWVFGLSFALPWAVLGVKLCRIGQTAAPPPPIRIGDVFFWTVALLLARLVVEAFAYH